MSSLARDAMKQAFLRMAEEKSLDKITVKDIVEACGMNRNSFYYHFQDLPDLLRWSLEQDLEALLVSHAREYHIDDAVNAVADFALEHRQAVLHIYASRHRDVLERSILQVCETIVSDFLAQTIFQEYSISLDDQETMIYFYRSLFYGMLIDWVNASMRYDIKECFASICQLQACDPHAMAKAAQARNHEMK